MNARKLFGSLAFAALVAGLLPVPAHAVTCSGYACEALDPTSTGCAADGRWLSSKAFGSGSTAGAIQMMWSQTCHTAWVRVSTYNNLGSSYTASFDANALYTSTGSPYFNNAYSYFEIYDPAMVYHRESKMIYTSGGSSSCCSDSRTLKACGGASGSSCQTVGTPLNQVPDECP